MDSQHNVEYKSNTNSVSVFLIGSIQWEKFDPDGVIVKYCKVCTISLHIFGANTLQCDLKHNKTDLQTFLKSIRFLDFHHNFSDRPIPLSIHPISNMPP